MSPATPLSSPIHGHDVLAMMLASGAVYTRASLLAAIGEKFGATARFFTCSAGNLTAAQLIDFLAERGKFAAVSGGFVLDRDKVCQHDHG